MDNDHQIMRCHIAGEWTAHQMARSFDAMRNLYNIRFGLEVYREQVQELDHALLDIDHIFFKRFRANRRGVNPFLIHSIMTGYFTIPITSEKLLHLAEHVYPHEELRVRRLEFASPGIKDLAGLGEVIGHVKELIVKLIDYFGERKKHQRQDEKEEAEIQAIRIENARKFVALARDCGLDDAEIRKLVFYTDEQQQHFIELIQSRRLVKVHLIDEHDSKLQ